MFNAILIIITILALAAWIYEKREGDASLRAAKRYAAERDEESKLRRKLASKHDAWVENYNALNDEYKLLQNRYEQAKENVSCLEARLTEINAVRDALTAENAMLKKMSASGIFSEWKMTLCAEPEGRALLERDGIVLIFEGGKIVGWRKADTVGITFNAVMAEEGEGECRDPSQPSDVRSFTSFEDDKTSDGLCSEEYGRSETASAGAEIKKADSLN